MLGSVEKSQQVALPILDGPSKTSASSARQNSFMDILTCRTCRKHRNKTRVEPNDIKDSNGNNNESTNTHAQLDGTTEEGSLKRPLSCKSVFGKRKSRERRNEEPPISTAIPWRSLPNLRSPSLTVRAMTLKFKALTNKDSTQDNKDTTQEKTTRKKKTHFNEAVDVIVHDDDGNTIDTQCVKIKYDDDNYYFDRSMAFGGKDDISLDRSPALRDRRMSNKDDLRLDYMNINRKTDGQRFIRMVIHIGEDFDRKRLTVRSANGGTKLVLTAHRSMPLGDGTYFWRECMEKFRLPHAIDPNEVNAVLHAAGDLVIEAPLFEFEGDT